MEFKRIDDTKFQCLLDEDDLEDNNISLDDFFRNDTKKICVCEIDNAYTFNEAEINSTDWKLATYIPVEILKNL